MKPDKTLFCMFLFSFFGPDLAQNTIELCLLRTEELNNRNRAQSMNAKRKIVIEPAWTSQNINLGIFVRSSDVCRDSKPIPCINSVLKQNARLTQALNFCCLLCEFLV